MKIMSRKFWCQHCHTLSEIALPVASTACPNPTCGISLIPPYTIADFKPVWTPEEPRNWLRIHRSRGYQVHERGKTNSSYEDNGER